MNNLPPVLTQIINKAPKAKVKHFKKLTINTMSLSFFLLIVRYNSKYLRILYFCNRIKRINYQRESALSVSSACYSSSRIEYDSCR